MSKQLLYQLIRFTLVIGIIIGVYLVFKYTFFYLYPFLLAVLFSIFINPFVTFLEKRLKLPRAFATFIIICTLFIFILGSITLVISELIQGSTYLAVKIPSHFQTFISFLEEFLDKKILPYYHKLTSLFQTLSMSQQATVNDYIHQLTTHISSSGATMIQNLLLKIPAILSLLPYSITILIFIVLATFLITNDLYSLKHHVIKFIPSLANEISNRVLIHLKKSLLGFFKAQVILIFITTCIIFIGLLFLKMEHALTISLLLAAIDLLPYLGTGIVFIPWIFYLFITENYSLTINLSILYIIIIFLRQILEPKLLSASIGLRPLTTLFALFIGIQLWGVFGIIIAPILLITVNAVHQAGITKQIWHFIKG